METKRTRRTFDPAFKVQAARRVVEGHEKAAVVAADLGVNAVSLYQWVKEFEKHKNAPAAPSPAPAAAPSESRSPLVQVETRTSPAANLNSAPAADSFSKPAEPAQTSLDLDAPKPVRNKIQLRPRKTPAPNAQVFSPNGDNPVNHQPAPQAYAPAADAVQTSLPLQPTSESVSPAPAAQTEAPTNKAEAPQNASPQRNGGSFNNFDRPSKFGRGRNRDRQKDKRQNPNQNQPSQGQAPSQAPQYGVNPSENAPAVHQQNNNAQRYYNSYDGEEEFAAPTPEVQIEPESQWPAPTASQGRRWKVMHALDQRPNYKEESQHFGYVDEFDLPAENLPEVWAILEKMQKMADRRAFENMVHEKELNVPPEVLADPRSMSVQGPNVPNKPWLRKMRMNPIADDFFQTTPDYLRSVYETYGGLTMRLAKNSKGTPILLIEPAPEGGRNITISFSKFDRFVDDFYGDFVRDCKTVMMKQNPKEYPSLNAFIRIPDEPIWNPKLWAGIRTFHWKDGETLAEAWIRYAQDLKRNNRKAKRYSADY